MVNSVSFTAASTGGNQKINGKTHNRKDELTVYRKAINEANAKMNKAADNGDLELAKFWSSIIDDAQAKIFAIIDQEDNHSYKKVDVYSKAGQEVMNGAQQAVDIASKIMLVA